MKEYHVHIVLTTCGVYNNVLGASAPLLLLNPNLSIKGLCEES